MERRVALHGPRGCMPCRDNLEPSILIKLGVALPLRALLVEYNSTLQETNSAIMERGVVLHGLQTCKPCEFTPKRLHVLRAPDQASHMTRRSLSTQRRPWGVLTEQGKHSGIQRGDLWPVISLGYDPQQLSIQPGVNLSLLGGFIASCLS